MKDIGFIYEFLLLHFLDIHFITFNEVFPFTLSEDGERKVLTAIIKSHRF